MKNTKNVIPNNHYKQNAEEVILELRTNTVTGLGTQDVADRIKHYGYNEIPEKKPNLITKFLKHFWGPAAWMLEAIIVLSLFLHNYLDFYIVSGLLLANAIISFFQEQRSSSVLETLKNKLQIHVRVLREGVWEILAAREIVPGDIIRTRAGDFIPVDTKIITGVLEVNQSALTGESLPVGKKPNDILYSGSIVNQGEATGVAIATGQNTYFGKIIDLMQFASPTLHIEKIVSKLSIWLLLIVFAMLVILVIKSTNFIAILPLLLVLLLSAVPVALPAMLVISFALGAQELAKKNVLVTRLNVLEDAACMDVLCIDKTGTLTLNQLSVAQVFSLDGYHDNDVLLYGALASQEADQDPIDKAFIEAAKQKNLLDSSFIIKKFTPFDPKIRRTEAIIQKEGLEFKVMKGAVDIIIHMPDIKVPDIKVPNVKAPNLKEKNLSQLTDKVSEFFENGYRVIAVAKNNNMQTDIVGLVALHDPIRPDAKETITELTNLGIRIKILTGDALAVAKNIAKNIGLGANPFDYSTIKNILDKDNTKAKAEDAIEQSDCFAEIYPKDKYDIVKILQEHGHIIGMTGDGINDAPALRQAEVGIAVNTATDVAKGAASVVLTQPGLSNIMELIKNGRAIFQRINTWILNKLTRTILKTSFIVIAFLITGKYVISASAMLLLVFMTDFVKLALATDNATISKKPNIWNIENSVRIAVILGFIIVIETMGLLFFGLKYLNLMTDTQALYTFSFEIVFYFAIFSILIERERKHFWNSWPSKTLLTIIMADIVFAMALTAYGLLGFKAAPFEQTFLVILYSFICSFVINDLIKFYLLKRREIK